MSMKPLLLSIVVFNVTNVTYRLMSDQAVSQRKAFGRLIRNLRMDRELDQAVVAERSQMSRQQWNRLEVGISGTRWETLERITAALGLRTGTREYEAVYKLAGFAPPVDHANLTDWTMDIPGSIQNTGDESDPVFHSEEADLLTLQALYLGVPPHVRAEIRKGMAQIVRDFQRGQTTHGKKAETDE